MPPVSFALTPAAATRHGPTPSLNLARSRSGPPSLSGSAVSDDESVPGQKRRRGSRASVTSRTSVSTPVTGTFPSTGQATEDAIPLLPSAPVDAGAWAAEHAHPPRLADNPFGDGKQVEEEGEERRRVQFADDPAVAVFDAEAASEESGELEFERPEGREMAAILLSFTGLTVLSIAAALTTIYDWVL